MILCLPNISTASPSVNNRLPLPLLLELTLSLQLQEYTLRNAPTVKLPLQQASIPLPHSIHTPTQNSSGALGIPGGDPPNDPPGDDPNSDFDSSNTPDAKDTATVVFINLAKAIKSLAKSSHHNPSETLQQTKVWELDQFDGTDLHKLWIFLIQCELNFQDHPWAFIQDHTKGTFAQSYLKGITLEWFKPDLLLMDDPNLCPFWMENYKEFVLELQTNFGPHDPVGDAEHQLDHLTMKDGQRITKYVVEFNQIAMQVQGYGEGALRHHFYNGLPDHIKDEVSCVGKPPTLSELRSLAQLIDARYWERKSEINRQAKPSAAPPSKSNKTPATSSMNSSGSKASPDVKGKTSTTTSSTPKSDLTLKLGSDRKLTSDEQKHCFDNKLCMFCRTGGHMAKDCPKSTTRASKGHSVTTTPETKPEDSSKSKK